MKQFNLFWNNGTKSIVTAPSISEAYSRFTPAQLENLAFYTSL